MKLARFTNAPRTADLSSTEEVESIGADEHGDTVRFVRILQTDRRRQEAAYGAGPFYLLDDLDLWECVSGGLIVLRDEKEDQRRHRT